MEIKHPSKGAPHTVHKEAGLKLHSLVPVVGEQEGNQTQEAEDPFLSHSSFIP